MEDKSQFAGFWRRAGAYLIDYAIVIVTVFVCAFVAGLVSGFTMALMGVQREAIKPVAGGLGLVIGLLILVFYWTLFECSSKQATPGKMALGIVVTDANGGRIGFWRAFGRQFARIVSSLFFCIGYIACAFTDRRQCAHDLLAATLVVKKDAPLRISGKDGFQIMSST